MSIVMLALGLFVLGILLNAFFAGYETGFVASNPIRIRYLAEKERNRNAIHLLRYIDTPDRMITVVLVGTNLALVMGTAAITSQLDTFWATIIATPLFLTFGEVVPKSMFRLHPTLLSLKLLPAIRLVDSLMAPVVVPTTWISQRFVAMASGETQDMRVLMTTLEDMRHLVDESADHGTIEQEEKDMIHSVIDLQTRQAQEIMVPRIDIKALPETATKSELIDLLKDSGFTRIPIYKESIDDIIGVVNAFDVLTDDEPEKDDILRFIKPGILHVPDTMKLDDLLEVIRGSKVHLAIVIDEYGGTDGLIALEDILEEIFGEIHDEHDKETRQLRRIGPNAYVIEARMSLEDVSDAIGIPLEDEEVETIGGWLMHITGRIPGQGEVIVEGRFRITVLSGGPNQVSSVRLEILPEVKEDNG